MIEIIFVHLQLLIAKNKMDIINNLYLLTIASNFIASIYFKRFWKQLLFLYFGIILVIDSQFFNFKSNFLYSFFDFFCILLFGYLYFKELKNKKLTVIITIISFCLGVYFYITSIMQDRVYSVYEGVVYCIFNIFLSILWFYEKIIGESEQKSILNYQFFWISTSFLLWSVFYVFRIVPMYWFSSHDNNFLILYQNIFSVVNFVSYSIFFRSFFTKR